MEGWLFLGVEWGKGCVGTGIWVCGGDSMKWGILEFLVYIN